MAADNSAISCHETPRKKQKKRNNLLFSGTLQEDTILISSAVTLATKHAVNARGFVCNGASLFNHAAVVLVTLTNVSRYDPRTITPICFVSTARIIIADTKNILCWRWCSAHSTHPGVTNLGNMTATWRCDESRYCGRVWRYVNVKKKNPHTRCYK
jgi:hypothetical protein